MNRTLTAFTAAIFATAIALPAFAQMSGDSSSTTSRSDSSESVKHDYQAQPAPMGNAVESSKRDYHSESSSESSAPNGQIERKVENDSTSSTTKQVTPPPVVEESTTANKTETESNTP